MICAISARGSLLGRTRVTGAKLEDWEDVSAARCPRGPCLYIADIGDNNARRPYVTIYRVLEPAPAAESTEPAEAIHINYPDGPQDAESVFITADAEIFVVSKGETGSPTVYQVPGGFRSGATVKLQRVSAVPGSAGRGGRRPSRVTDAESSPDGRWIVLRTHDAAHFYRTVEFLSRSPDTGFRVDLSTLREPQGEGIAVDNAGHLYLVGEGGLGAGTFATFPCSFDSESPNPTRSQAR